MSDTDSEGDVQRALEALERGEARVLRVVDAGSVRLKLVETCDESEQNT